MTRRKRAIDEHYVRKPSNETVNNSSTLQNDDDLLFPVGASETWVVDVYLHWQSDATPDFKFNFSLPSGGTSEGMFIDAADSAIFDNATNGVLTRSSGGDILAMIHFTFINSTTAGNVQFQWAQNVANASNTYVYAGSTLIARRVN